jgi:hypothetical protein
MIDMLLDPNVNYIVSGLERSGTSMIMQILSAAKVPIAYDRSRLADISNPKGYYELKGGKIINSLINKTFQFNRYKGTFIKITAYGLKFLPTGSYKIIYTERNIDEVLDSMEQMANISDADRLKTKKAFNNLNKQIKYKLETRDDIKYLVVNYNEIIENPHIYLKKILDFLDLSENSIASMQEVVDKKLYRQRRNSK